MNRPEQYPFQKDALEHFKVFLADQSAKLQFKSSPDPIISIVLLTYNKAELTFACLQSLQQNLTLPYELIIVDNASVDQTKDLFAKTHGAQIIMNSQNIYYARGIHTGAEKAKGKYLLLLNSDIQLFPNFDQELLNCFNLNPNAGAVGAQLILPSGKLQEAGSMLSNLGVPWGYGREDHPSHWQYLHTREVDYCSAAVLLVDRELFWRVGGFDLSYEPAYFEDADLCMKIREAGFRVFYTPFAKAYHHEHGTSDRLWVVNQLEKNRRIFMRRWKKVLKEAHHSRRLNRFRSRERGSEMKILMIDNRVPVPGHGGGYPRAFKIIETIRKLGYSITLFPLKKNEVDVTAWSDCQRSLREIGVEVVEGDITFPEFARDRAGQFDLIWVGRASAMERVFFDLKALLPEIPIVYDSEAISFDRIKLKAEFEKKPLDQDEYKKIMRNELVFFELSEQVLFVSEQEQKKIEPHVPSVLRKSEILGYASKTVAKVMPLHQRKDIYFIGGFLGDFGLNEHAILYFLDHVFPKIRSVNACNFVVAGANIPEKILARQGNGVIIKGFVEKLEDVYDYARLMVMPHQYAGGIPLKLTESLSFGVPCVVSPLIASQLAVSENQGVLVANTSDDYVKMCLSILEDDRLWTKLSKNAIDFIVENHAVNVWEEKVAKILSKMESTE